MTRVIKHFPTHRLYVPSVQSQPGHCPLQSVEEQVTLLKGNLEEEEEVYTDWSTDWGPELQASHLEHMTCKCLEGAVHMRRRQRMRCSSCNAREKSVINPPGSRVHLLGYTQGWYYVVTGGTV